MSENNKSYRIRTEVGKDKSLYVKLDQKFDILEILSLKLRQEGLYKLHTSDYGVIVGRVLANNGFGIPNAKVSVFIQISDDDIRRNEILGLYSYNTTRDKDADGIRYNLLPDTPVNECHKVVGTFPSKTMVLDNDIVLEVYDKYFKFTTKTNESGDYMIFGVPTGNQTVHVDLDLSDIGLLSQRPRDFVYKGYTIEQFENPNQFKSGTDLNGLSQIFSQDSMVEVIPFWGDENEGLIGISRNDVDIQFKFEPTCVFIGSVVSDNSSNGFSKKCIPTNSMGNMDELVTGNGTIEMIRKKPDGTVEEFQIQGNQLINGNGIWCYQIPMNLDYMKTDEYGNMVPTDNPEEGIPTRARVRFRISMQDFEENVSNYFRAKVLVPHNPETSDEVDYTFGSGTQDCSYRDLFWNNVYSVKSYIPRIQKGRGIRTERFSGIKHCNIHGQNNPIPYNNIRIRLPFMFTVICAIIKAYIWVLRMLNKFLGMIPGLGAWGKKDRDCVFIGDSLCPDLEGWYFAPGCSNEQKSALVLDFSGFDKENFEGQKWWKKIETFFEAFGQIISIHKFTMLQNTYNQIASESLVTDKYSIDVNNRDSNEEGVCLTNSVDYLIQCIEINLAQEYKVIQFDFYNDWINGLIYIPRWMRFVRKKRKYLFGLIKTKAKVKGCMTDTSMFAKDRYLVDQCSLSYSYKTNSGFTQLASSQKTGCANKKQKCHKKHGRNMVKVFGRNGGLVNETKTLQNQNVYYFKPCEWSGSTKVNFFATDLCLLGSLNDCDLYGIPQAFKTLTSSSYQLPTNLALTNMEEDGYMYSQEDSGTICNTKAGYNANEKVKQADNSFSGAKKHNPNEYTYSGYDDTVPITESAGIDWGYTGPGQGVSEFSSSRIYQPGGHFLGLSCSQAETNIKSCINLGRICEHGVGMSQRVLIPNTYNEATDSWNYVNIMPNGFISQDEIYDHDFRTMFATMNYNNLKTKRDEKTGYLKYDFIVSMPTNFDGSFNKYSSGYTSLYNSMSDNKLKTESVGGITTTTDNEASEVTNSKVRSLEYTNNDYYRFRFGMTGATSQYNDKKYFLINNGSTVSMPVYRNSFYFYFGLTDGATAFDEFKKQFFSTCKNTQDSANSLSLSSASFKCYNREKSEYNFNDFLNGGEVNGVIKDGTVVAVIKVNGGQMPYNVEIINEYGETTGTYSNLNTKSIQIPITTVTVKNGSKYRVKITDAEDVEVIQDYDFGITSIFSLNLSSYDYYVTTNKINSSDRPSNCDLYGGYISWDGGLTMLGQDISEKNTKYNISVSPICVKGKTSDGIIAYYPKTEKPGTYKVNLEFNSGYSSYSFEYKEYTINGVDDLDYWIGDEKLLASKFRGTISDWYKNLTEEEKWYYRHSFFRQDKNSGLSVRTGISGRTPYMETYVAGTPEKSLAADEVTGEVLAESCPKFKAYSATNGQTEEYEGYDLDLNNIYGATEAKKKQEYQYVIYDTRGQMGVGPVVVNNKTNLKIETDGRITGLSGLRTGYRYLVTNKNISLLGYAYGADAGVYNSSSIKIDTMIASDLYDNKGLIEGVPTQVYGFHCFPIYYKPFYFEIYAWSAVDNPTIKSYGTIYNGITYDRKFTSILCNGRDLTSNITTSSNSSTSDMSSNVKYELTEAKLGINTTDFTNGEITFSCIEGHPSSVSNENVITRGTAVSFTFAEDIKISKDTTTGILKVNITGKTDGAKYYVINANSSDKNGKSNGLSFPCLSNNTNEWNNSSNLLQPKKIITGSEYTYGDWLSTDSLDLLDSYYKVGNVEKIPSGIMGSQVQNVTSVLSENASLSLRYGANLSDAYILGVADVQEPDGSTICTYCVYNKFQTISLFNGTYTFGDPSFDVKSKKITLIITVADSETWSKITASDVTITPVINGSVSYSDKNINDDLTKGQKILENLPLTFDSKKTTSTGGEMVLSYNGEHVQYKDFTMKGVTTLKISGTVQSGTDENGNPITSTVEEQFSSGQWTFTGQQELSESDYIWLISVTGQNDDGKLLLRISIDPWYAQMKGTIKDTLNFNFYVNGDRENPLTATVTSTSFDYTYDVNFADITSISGEIIDNPEAEMYSYNGKVTLV